MRKSRFFGLVVLASAVLISGQCLAAVKNIGFRDFAWCDPTHKTSDWNVMVAGYPWDVTGAPGQLYWQFKVADAVDDVNYIVVPSGYYAQINSVDLDVFYSGWWDNAGGVGGYNYTLDGLYAVSVDSWTKATLDWSNKPALGAQIGTITWAYPYDPWLEIGDTSGSIATPGLAAFIEQQINSDGLATLGVKGLNAENIYGSWGGGDTHMYAGTETNPGWVMLHIDYTLIPDPAMQFDLNGNKTVDLADLQLFAIDWLKCVEPADLSCSKPW